MNENRGKILWIDDEIDHLKPHILFLQEKGYEITTSSNGKDGIDRVSSHSFDLILVDQFMPGIDGMETVEKIKISNPSIPIIMITKSEEEWLMDEAIYKKIDHLLIKPVNPNQIFVACKQILENIIIHSEKSKTEYLSQFQNLEFLLDQYVVLDLEHQMVLDNDYEYHKGLFEHFDHPTNPLIEDEYPKHDKFH